MSPLPDLVARLGVLTVLVAGSVPSDPTDLDIDPRPGGPGWLLFPLGLLVVGGLGLFGWFMHRGRDDEPPRGP